MQQFQQKNIEFKSIKETIDFNSSTGTFMLTLLAALAELETSMISERQREGIELAKAQGKYKGRAKIKRLENFLQCYDKWRNSNRFDRKYSLKDFANETNLKRATLINFINQHRKLEQPQTTIASINFYHKELWSVTFRQKSIARKYV